MNGNAGGWDMGMIIPPLISPYSLNFTISSVIYRFAASGLGLSFHVEFIVSQWIPKHANRFLGFWVLGFVEEMRIFQGKPREITRKWL